MSEIVVLERRRTERRSRDSAGTRAPAEGERRSGIERRAYVLGHHITVGPVAGTDGSMGGVCSCSEHSVSRLEGAIEAWARGHRDEMIALRPFGRAQPSTATR